MNAQQLKNAILQEAIVNHRDRYLIRSKIHQSKRSATL